jgi:hypothetical protein
MHKTLITNPEPRLGRLVELVADELRRPPATIQLYGLRSRRWPGERYALEAGDSVTPAFDLGDLHVEIDEPEDLGSVALVAFDEAARLLARELADLAPDRAAPARGPS